jgi:tRNA dimethylallyltransferase
LPETPVFWREASIVGLREDRALLTERLNERVLEMWRAGFLDEVAELRDAGIERGLTASRAIGYAQALAQLRGELNQTQAIDQTQALTRRYARRQMSWFKRYPNTRWFQAGANNLAQRILDTEDPGDF